MMDATKMVRAVRNNNSNSNKKPDGRYRAKMLVSIQKRSRHLPHRIRIAHRTCEV